MICFSTTSRKTAGLNLRFPTLLPLAAPTRYTHPPAHSPVSWFCTWAPCWQMRVTKDQSENLSIISSVVTTDRLYFCPSSLFIYVLMYLILPSCLVLFLSPSLLPSLIRPWSFLRVGVSSGCLGESLLLQMESNSTTTRTFGCCTWLQTPGRTLSMCEGS